MRRHDPEAGGASLAGRGRAGRAGEGPGLAGPRAHLPGRHEAATGRGGGGGEGGPSPPHWRRAAAAFPPPPRAAVRLLTYSPPRAPAGAQSCGALTGTPRRLSEPTLPLPRPIAAEGEPPSPNGRVLLAESD